MIRRRFRQHQAEKLAQANSPRRATRSRARRPGLRNSQSAATGSSGPARVPAGPHRRRIARTSPRRIRRSYAGRESDSVARRTDGRRCAANPVSPPTSTPASHVAVVCPSPLPAVKYVVSIMSIHCSTMTLMPPVPMRLVFETHATSLDNEVGLASGWFDVALSAAGEEQARTLGARRRADHLAAVFCSDLSRSFRTAEIAFGDCSLPIVRDARLRECDYGDLTRHPMSAIEQRRRLQLVDPFPNGKATSRSWTESPDGLVRHDLTWMPAPSSSLGIARRTTRWSICSTGLRLTKR